MQRESTPDGGLELPHEAVHSPANIGIMLVRANANAFAKVCFNVLCMWSFLLTQNSSFACCGTHSCSP